MALRLISATIIVIVLCLTPLRLIGSLEAPFTWDEADIHYVAEKGVLANYLNQPSAPLIEFLKLGLAKANNDQDAVKEISRQLPDEREDLFIRRHFHPPLSVYLWSLFYAENATPEKQAFLLRTSTFIAWAIFIFSLLWCSWWVTGKSPLNPIVALLLLATLGSGFFARNLMYLNYHLLLGVCAIWYTASLIQFTRNPSRKHLILFGLTAALLVAALETHIVILFLSIVYVVILRRSVFLNLSFLKRFLITLAIAVLALWPGFFLTGEVIKSWMMYAYRIFLANNEEYASVDSISSWGSLVAKDPLLFLCMFGGSIAAIILLRKTDRLYFLPLVCSLGYFIFISPFIIFEHYLLPAIFMMIFALVLMASHRASEIHFNKVKTGISIMLAACICFFLYFNDNSNRRNEKIAQSSAQWYELINFLHQVPDEKPLLIDGGHLFDIYLQNHTIRLLETYSSTTPGFYERTGHEYVNRRNDIINGEVGAIVIKKSRPYADSTLQTLVNHNYIKYDFPDYLVFVNE